MKEFKPDIVIGVGGYVTFPVLRVARKLKIKTFIHEQNSIPGKSNKVLSKKTDLIGVSFKDTLKYFGNNAFLSRNPCGEMAIDRKPMSKKEFGVPLNHKCVLIVQGSLGSGIINKKMEEYLRSIKEENYNNGPMEGTVNKIKAIKRSMFNRAGEQLLRAKIIYANYSQSP